jgi:hypothetical protein
MDALQHTVGGVLVIGFLYLVHICHLMHRRQERLEHYCLTAVRMGTLLAGSAAIGPLLAFLQAPHTRQRRGQ